MKNYRTPRTLADCQFEVGYLTARPSPRAQIGYVIVTLAAFAGIGVILALGA